MPPGPTRALGSGRPNQIDIKPFLHVDDEGAKVFDDTTPSSDRAANLVLTLEDPFQRLVLHLLYTVVSLAHWSLLSCAAVFCGKFAQRYETCPRVSWQGYETCSRGTCCKLGTAFEETP